MELKELIEVMHYQWRKAKDNAERDYRNKHFTYIADKLKKCNMFKGNENLGELIELYKSPQGLEFCIKNNFPILSMLQYFKPYNTEKYGVYIDAGNIKLINPATTIILVGNTTGTITCTETKRFQFVAVHSAKATINSYGFSVISAKHDDNSEIIHNANDNAVIL